MNKQRDNVTRCMLVFWLVASFSVVIKGCDSNITRHDLERNVVIVCCSVTCPEDHQVVKCQVNGSADTCEPCPPGTFMDDTTDSHDPFPCSEFNCPPESIPALNYPESGCRHKKCVCDVGRGFVGPDPCACQQSRLVCPEGSELTIHNNCTVKDPSTNSDVGTTIPMETTTVYLIDNTTEGPWSGVTETQRPDVSNPPSGEHPSKWRWVVPIIVLVVLVALALMGAAYKFKKPQKLCESWKNDEKRNTPTGERGENIALNSVSISEKEPIGNGLHYTGNGVDVQNTAFENGGGSCYTHENNIEIQNRGKNSNENHSDSVSNTDQERNTPTGERGENIALNSVSISEKEPIGNGLHYTAICIEPVDQLNPESMKNDNQNSIDLLSAPSLDSLLKGAVQ